MKIKFIRRDSRLCGNDVTVRMTNMKRFKNDVNVRMTNMKSYLKNDVTVRMTMKSGFKMAVLFILWVVHFSTWSDKPSIHELNDRLARMSAERTNLNNEIKNLHSRVEKAADKKKHRWLGTQWEQSIDDDDWTRIYKWRQEHKKLSTELQTKQESLQNLNSQIQNLELQLNEAKVPVIQRLQTQMHTKDLRDDLSDMRWDLLTIDDKLYAIKDTYDQRRLGAYIQAKITQLLQSKVLCQACGHKGVTADEIQKALFPTSNIKQQPQTQESTSSKGDR